MGRVKAVEKQNIEQIETNHQQNEIESKKTSTLKTGDTKTQKISTSKIEQLSDGVKELVQNGIPKNLEVKSIKVVEKRSVEEIQIRENDHKKTKYVTETKKTVQVTKKILSLEEKKKIVLNNIDELSDSLTLGFWKRGAFTVAIAVVKSSLQKAETWKELELSLKGYQKELPWYKSQIDVEQHHLLDKYAKELDKFFKEHAI